MLVTFHLKAIKRFLALSFLMILNTKGNIIETIQLSSIFGKFSTAWLLKKKFLGEQFEPSGEDNISSNLNEENTFHIWTRFWAFLTVWETDDKIIKLIVFR